MTSTTKQPKIGADVRRAFAQWMSGQPWTVLKAKVKRPLQAAFTELARASSWKAARAQRDRQVKQQERKRGAA